MAATIKSANNGAFILPYDSAAEASLVQDAIILPARSLLEVCAHLSGHTELAPYRVDVAPSLVECPDFSEVKGQSLPKRALEIAAAGGHSVLMSGPPGTGKSMLASRFAGILPEMTEQEALESAALQSLSGSFRTKSWRRRPFRSPHHTASGVALVGGGGIPRPSEISLAHHRSRISGPLLDRIDLHIEVPALKEDELTASHAGEASASIRERVERARRIQIDRQGKANFLLGSKEIDKLCAPDEAGMALLKQAISRLNLSARAYHRILKVARSIADLAGESAISSAHIAEAVQYRRFEI